MKPTWLRTPARQETCGGAGASTLRDHVGHSLVCCSVQWSAQSRQRPEHASTTGRKADALGLLDAVVASGAGLVEALTPDKFIRVGPARIAQTGTYWAATPKPVDAVYAPAVRCRCAARGFASLSIVWPSSWPGQAE